MSKEQLDRMENLLTQLVTSVGKTNSELQSMKEEQASIKHGQASMQQELSFIKKEQSSMREDICSLKEGQTLLRADIQAHREETRSQYKEVIQRLDSIEADQDHIWEKASRNEREIAKIKRQ
ncbi:hypothetical protein [Halalkalibacter sp. APA_J-10(15)]|uniref:hypothetical protein n=1 Tax=Halalkalibacter sp. APA_J-10(15) TaxID=2933805 RepID=UPI001FF103A2|nr:hypothetical protein [Halalkalibacter sp. APA_J-10(15)]MCK0471065.1 hypothetical protein [Halalkalibacter sp. APA_J-10(15)]